MRPFHVLRRNYKAEQPTHLLFVDTESAIEHVTPRLQRHTLALGFALYVRRRRVHGVDTYTEEPCRFTTPAAFWDFAEAHAYAGTKLTIYAHNWNYDAGILQTATIPHDRGWTCTSYVNEKPPFILKLRRGRATISMIDTLNYFGSALAALGEQIGLSKGEMPAPDAPESEWWWYCERDCRIVSELVITWLRFLRDHDLGNYQATLASQAFTAYRHRFMSSPIQIHDRARICELEREGYHGGRTECFQLGTVERQLHYLDVNSLYPYVMREHPYPTRYVEARRAPAIDTLARWVEGSCVVARVEVETSEPVFPAAPRKARFRGGAILDNLKHPGARVCAAEGAYTLDRTCSPVRSCGTIPRLGRRAIRAPAAIRCSWRSPIRHALQIYAQQPLR